MVGCKVAISVFESHVLVCEVVCVIFAVIRDTNVKMDTCCSYDDSHEISISSVPLWVGPLLHAASRLKKTDRMKRRKVYRLIQRQLVSVTSYFNIIFTLFWLILTLCWQLNNRVGCSTSGNPTYVYPTELKEMVRSAFPKGICDYGDPCHKNVRYIYSLLKVDARCYKFTRKCE